MLDEHKADGDRWGKEVDLGPSLQPQWKLDKKPVTAAQVSCATLGPSLRTIQAADVLLVTAAACHLGAVRQLDLALKDLGAAAHACARRRRKAGLG